MNDQPGPPTASLAKIDRLCDQFESALRRGERAEIEDRLGEVETVLRAELLRELLLVEWEILRERGQPVEAQGYLGRFPAEQAMIRELFQRAAAPEEPKSVAHYKIIRKLGAGGMGVVYLAEDTKLERRVALKLLPPKVAADAARRHRFLTEAKAASALNHPNVCVIHEVGETPLEQLYIAMEFVEGETLAERLRQGRFEIHDLVDIGSQVADALDAACARGIVHRDIKPSNICLNERRQVKVLDFGLAKRLGSGDEAETTMHTTATGQILGTPSYMSPEQALGREVDHRTDIFSLGVVLYELVTGRVPFAGSSIGEIVDRIARAQPEALARYNYDVPAELERLIRKCLEKDPNRRYQSPRELFVDLQNLRRDLDRAAQAGPSGKPFRPVAAEASATTTQIEAAPGPESSPSGTETLSVEVLKESDIFINYAGIDDQSVAEGRQGWVSQLHRNLQVRLQQLTGEAVKISSHPGYQGASRLSTGVLERLSEVKAMVSIVSPPFVKSEECLREVEEFWQGAEKSGALWVDEKSRLLKVVKSPVSSAEIPPELQALFSQLFGFEFFEKDPETGRVREFDEAFGDLPKHRFHERVYDLAHELAQVLKVLRHFKPREGAGGLLQAGRRFVYLATTTSELQSERDRIRRELIERGHTVLPDAPLPQLSEDVQRVVLTCLEKCAVAIHLLGRHYGVTPEDSSESVQALQVRLTARRAGAARLQRLIWIPGNLGPVDERQSGFVRQVQEDPELQRDAEIIEGNINLLKQILIRRLTTPAEKPALPAPAGAPRSGAPVVYLICEPRDEEAAAPLEDYLFSQGLEVSLPAFDGSDAEAEALHRENLLTCDMVIVYYGQAPRAWVEIKLREILKAPGYGRTTPFRLQAVYIAPPDDRRKERFHSHQAQVIQQPGEFAASPGLREFVKSAREARA